MKTIITLQIHSCMASFSSQDGFLYQENEHDDRNPLEIMRNLNHQVHNIKFEREEVKNYNGLLVRFVYIRDETFYKMFSITEHATKEQMDDRVFHYRKNYNFTQVRPSIKDQISDREQELRKEQRKLEGHVLWMDVDEWKDNTDIKEGLLCEELTENSYLKNYINNGYFGYIGHENRTYKTDIEISRWAQHNPQYIDAIATWLTSTYARHYMDSFSEIFDDDSIINHITTIVRQGIQILKEEND